jgi:hypothetical protein
MMMSAIYFFDFAGEVRECAIAAGGGKVRVRARGDRLSHRELLRPLPPPAFLPLSRLLQIPRGRRVREFKLNSSHSIKMLNFRKFVIFVRESVLN